jgi:hypothetical protein
LPSAKAPRETYNTYVPVLRRRSRRVAATGRAIEDLAAVCRSARVSSKLAIARRMRGSDIREKASRTRNASRPSSNRKGDFEAADWSLDDSNSSPIEMPSTVAMRDSRPAPTRLVPSVGLLSPDRPHSCGAERSPFLHRAAVRLFKSAG